MQVASLQLCCSAYQAMSLFGGVCLSPLQALTPPFLVPLDSKQGELKVLPSHHLSLLSIPLPTPDPSTPPNAGSPGPETGKGEKDGSRALASPNFPHPCFYFHCTHTCARH